MTKKIYIQFVFTNVHRAEYEWLSKNETDVRYKAVKMQQPHYFFFLQCSVGEASINNHPAILRFEIPYSAAALRNSQEHPVLEAVRGNQMKQINTVIAERVDMLGLKDREGRSVLHLATLNNNSFLLQQLMAKQKKILHEEGQNEEKVAEQIIKWINLKDSQGNTAIMLSSYVGNIEIIKLLLQSGGDLGGLNQKGQSLIHLAAQGNQVMMVVFLREQYQQLPGSVDDEGTTPLHQACYHSAFNVASVLLSWGVDINHRDNQGFTALHVCALRGQNRIVKKLLYRGAEKTVLNHQQETASQVALRSRNEDVFNTLTTQSAKCQQTCVRMSVKPRKRTRQFLFAFLGFFGLSLVLTILFTIPFVPYSWEVYLYLIFVGITLQGFVLASFSDPGYLPMLNGKSKLFQLLQLSDMEDLCADCVILKPFRSRHCEFCQRCVMVYDHHCPWIDNCIGAKNHGYFCMFVLGLFVTDIISLCLTFQCFGSGDVHFDSLMTWDWNSKSQVGQIFAQLLVVLVGGGFLFALSYIIYVQTNNLLTDQTTFERLIVGKVKRGNSMYRQRLMSRHSIKENVSFQDKSLKNCALVCCQNRSIKRYMYEPEAIPAQ